MQVPAVPHERYNREYARVADGVPPVAEFLRKPGFLENKNYPQEDFHDVFAEQMQYVVGQARSPFVDRAFIKLLLEKEYERALQRLDDDPSLSTREVATDYCKAVARQVNAHIQENIRRNDALRKEYDQAIARSKASGT